MHIHAPPQHSVANVANACAVPRTRVWVNVSLRVVSLHCGALRVQFCGHAVEVGGWVDECGGVVAVDCWVSSLDLHGREMR